jgi:hypothetical protein
MMTQQRIRFLGALAMASLTVTIAGCVATARAQPRIALEKPDLTVAVVPTTDRTAGFYPAYRGKSREGVTLTTFCTALRQSWAHGIKRKGFLSNIL